MQCTMKWTVRALVVAVTLGLLASSAFAAQNVANTAQKGSLLIFPLIDVRPIGNTLANTTVVRISNDGDQNVWVKCYYLNETKFRRDFQFRLTKKQSVAFDVSTGETEALGNLASFPTEVGEFPNITTGRRANPFLGELICFATNPAGSAQISHNHLSGTATVGIFQSAEDVSVGVFAYEYNSWNFAARGVARGGLVGTAGRLDLNGLHGGYDACPAYNIVHFSSTVAIETISIDTRIGVSSCLQDLRQDYTPHFTKLEFNIWNAHEVKFTGAWECANSTHSFLLSELDRLPSNASRTSLGTDAAYAQIRGTASTNLQCATAPFPTEATGLVAVSARVLVQPLDDVGSFDIALHGTTTNHAGEHATPGFILWDPQDDVVPESAGKK